MVAVGYATGKARQKEEVRVGQEAWEVETDPLLPTFGGFLHPQGGPGDSLYLLDTWGFSSFELTRSSLQNNPSLLFFYLDDVRLSSLFPLKFFSSSKLSDLGWLLWHAEGKWAFRVGPLDLQLPTNPSTVPRRQRPLTVGRCSG